MKRWVLIGLIALAGFAPTYRPRTGIRIGSKKFTESVLLGEMLSELVRTAGESVQHVSELGGSRLLFEALRSGDIDAYPEYTGTLMEEILAAEDIRSRQQLEAALAKDQLRISRPLGFNNTYALGIRRQRAEELKIVTISDLRRHPQLRFGFSNEFLQRADGWVGLRQAYGMNQVQVTGMDHDIAYRQLQQSQIDVIDIYTTDAKIRELDLAVLTDDRGFFPRYDAVILYRERWHQRPDVEQALTRLEGKIDAATMAKLNYRVEVDGVVEATVASDFLRDRLGIGSTVQPPTVIRQIITRSWEHLDLVRRSLLPAILVGIPLGIFATRRKWLGQLLLGGVGIIQTIPALALLVLLLPVSHWLGMDSVGTGSGTAVLALFLYSLLPIVRNTHAGLESMDAGMRESAEVLNLPPRFRLWEIDLPLASRSILAGIKTSAVINVGFATLGALVGAGGYGQPILSGIRLADTGLILQGAIPAAVLAILVQLVFEGLERYFVPAGLRG